MAAMPEALPLFSMVFARGVDSGRPVQLPRRLRNSDSSPILILHTRDVPCVLRLSLCLVTAAPAADSSGSLKNYFTIQSGLVLITNEN